MKKALGMCAWCAWLALPAPADDTPPAAAAKSAPAAIAPSAPVAVLQPAPTTQTMPAAPVDGVEFSTDDPEAIVERTMEIEAEAKRNAPTQPSPQSTEEASARAADQDWMLRGYEDQLKKAGLTSLSDTAPASGSQPSDSSITTATDADSLFNPPEQPAPAHPAPRTSEPTPETPRTSLSSWSSLTSLQPLLPPLNSPAVQAPRDAFGSSPAPAVTSSFDSNMVPPPVAVSDHNTDSSSLDIPGLTASENGMGAPRDLSFQDALPDDTSAPRTKKTADRNNFMLPVPPTTDVAEFFKKQAEALQPPTAPSVLPTLTLPAKPALPTAPPRPMAKPAISGLRSHVDDPFDYLNR
jgi:hypothetical protein